MTQPTIYVAGASADLARAKSAMHAAVSVGFRVLFDWTAAIEAEAAKGNRDSDLVLEEQRRYAAADLHAATIADVFWLLVPSQKSASIGAWVELGAALVSMRVRQGLYEKSPLVVASAPDNALAKFSIFTALVTHRFDSDKEALECIAQLPVQRAAALELERRSARGYEWVVPYEAPPADSD